jgi:hypothetical protein
MDGTKGHHVKWNKSDMERQVSHDLSHMWKQQQQKKVHLKVVTRD